MAMGERDLGDWPRVTCLDSAEGASFAVDLPAIPNSVPAEWATARLSDPGKVASICYRVSTRGINGSFQANRKLFDLVL
jgi:hypothetical protein